VTVGSRRREGPPGTGLLSCADRIYNERIISPGAWNKVVVVAREDDDEAVLNHALIQSRRRYRS
jgi:hypothetical protein